jgi:hypothetical protein
MNRWTVLGLVWPTSSQWRPNPKAETARSAWLRGCGVRAPTRSPRAVRRPWRRHRRRHGPLVAAVQVRWAWGGYGRGAGQGFGAWFSPKRRLVYGVAEGGFCAVMFRAGSGEQWPTMTRGRSCDSVKARRWWDVEETKRKTAEGGTHR